MTPVVAESFDPIVWLRSRESGPWRQGQATRAWGDIPISVVVAIASALLSRWPQGGGRIVGAREAQRRRAPRRNSRSGNGVIGGEAPRIGNAIAEAVASSPRWPDSAGASAGALMAMPSSTSDGVAEAVLGRPRASGHQLSGGRQQERPIRERVFPRREAASVPRVHTGAERRGRSTRGLRCGRSAEPTLAVQSPCHSQPSGIRRVVGRALPRSGAGRPSSGRSVQHLDDLHSARTTTRPPPVVGDGPVARGYSSAHAAWAA